MKVLSLGLLLDIFVPELGQDGPSCLENSETNPLFQPQQLLFLQLCPKINPMARLSLLLAVVCLDLAQMVQVIRTYLRPTKFFILKDFCFNRFAQKSIPASVLALSLLTPGSCWP